MAVGSGAIRWDEQSRNQLKIVDVVITRWRLLLERGQINSVIKNPVFLPIVCR